MRDVRDERGVSGVRGVSDARGVSGVMGVSDARPVCPESSLKSLASRP